jgi:hypothetical protein
MVESYLGWSTCKVALVLDVVPRSLTPGLSSYSARVIKCVTSELDGFVQATDTSCKEPQSLPSGLAVVHRDIEELVLDVVPRSLTPGLSSYSARVIKCVTFTTYLVD